MSVHVSEPNRVRDPHAFRTPGAFLQAVREAAIGGAVDPALRPLRAAAGSDEAGTYSDPAGGYLVPEGLAPIVLGVSVDDDPSAGRMQPVPMKFATTSVNARVDKDHATSVSGGLRITPHAETADITTTRAKFEQIPLTAHERAGLTFVSERVITDDLPSFTALLETLYRDEAASTLFNERVNGTGIGECLGVLNSPALITVSKESGQAASTIVWKNVVNMRARCWRYQDAVWLATQEAVPQLSTLSAPVGPDSTHVPIWAPQNDSGMPEQLLGRPVYFSSDYAHTLGEVGDLILVNWSQYLDGLYLPLQAASSIHVRFIALERAFRFLIRRDGAPWWRSPLTPRRSSVTLSPYVTLAARS